MVCDVQGECRQTNNLCGLPACNYFSFTRFLAPWTVRGKHAWNAITMCLRTSTSEWNAYVNVEFS